MIDSNDLPSADEDLALRVIGAARLIAPNLDSLTGESRKTAVAILRSAAKDAATSNRVVKSQRVGSAAVEYNALDSWFSPTDLATLRALSGQVDAPAGPVGSFPKPALLQRIWPEQY